MNGLTMRTPADLIAATPYMLRFHPDHGIVVLGFHDKTLRGAARLDLPPQPPPPAYGHALIGPLRHHGATTVAILGYGPAHRVDPAVPVVHTAAQQQNLNIKDMLRVHHQRWWSYLCHRPECCPPEGSPYDPATSTIPAAATTSGLMAWPNRADLKQHLTQRYHNGASIHALASSTSLPHSVVHQMLTEAGVGPRSHEGRNPG